jgi:hypothetical protein
MLKRLLKSERLEEEFEAQRNCANQVARAAVRKSEVALKKAQKEA